MERTTRLVLQRTKKQPTLYIGDAKVTVEAAGPVKVVVEAPQQTQIVRGELERKGRVAA